ncbi:unnamed protein product [Effrenium voratum]|uniref:C3H1-type domain-containing protein n=1 Tax=Effrenium voratum TaxID=2562239 RepID=A0AA36J2G0_9DINO|nr:unnamed protein product [Effrenium voratum]CAJ1397275.1 unnamed protein product [Effrenium voratum]CAJ1424072.1 unnamed protein product [Effrenium voratum]
MAGHQCGDHVHIVWANSSDASSSQSETPRGIMRQTPFMPTGHSSSSSRNSQDLMYDLHVNFGRLGGQSPGPGMAQNYMPGGQMHGQMPMTPGMTPGMTMPMNSQMNNGMSNGPYGLPVWNQMNVQNSGFVDPGQSASQGMQQNMPQQGLQQNMLPQTLQQGMQQNLQGMQQGAQQGMQQGTQQILQQGVQQGMQQNTQGMQRAQQNGSQAAPEAPPVQSQSREANGANGDAGQVSKGSAGHAKGTCRPCHYFHSRTGCANGDQCMFCHLKHPKRSRVRIPKQYRQQCRALAQLVYDTQNCEKDLRQEMELQLLIQTSFDHRLTAYATSVLKSLRGGAVLQDFPQGLAVDAAQAK